MDQNNKGKGKEKEKEDDLDLTLSLGNGKGNKKLETSNSNHNSGSGIPVRHYSSYSDVHSPMDKGKRVAGEGSSGAGSHSHHKNTSYMNSSSFPPHPPNYMCNYYSNYGLHGATSTVPVSMYAGNYNNAAAATARQNYYPSPIGQNYENMRFCRHCGTRETPLWRKGPDGRQTLCNACGLKHLRSAKKDTEESRND